MEKEVRCAVCDKVLKNHKYPTAVNYHLECIKKITPKLDNRKETI